MRGIAPWMWVSAITKAKVDIRFSSHASTTPSYQCAAKPVIRKTTFAVCLDRWGEEERRRTEGQLKVMTVDLSQSKI